MSDRKYFKYISNFSYYFYLKKKNVDEVFVIVIYIYMELKILK